MAADYVIVHAGRLMDVPGESIKRNHSVIIKDGHIIREGTPDEIAADPQVREIYLGENFRLT